MKFSDVVKHAMVLLLRPIRLPIWPCIRTEQAALEVRSGTDGERKTITALFADLKGSTALIEGLDPEEARAIIDPALQLMMDAVPR
jgi:class 3 adenylate cyclase